MDPEVNADKKYKKKIDIYCLNGMQNLRKIYIQ